MKTRATAIAAATAAMLVFAAPSFAIEPNIVLQADGTYLDTVTGTRAPTIEGVMGMVAGLSPSAPSAPSVQPAVIAEPEAPTPAAVSSGSLKDAVVRARTMLEARVAEMKAKQKKPKTAANTAAAVDVTVAVWNRLTDEIRFVEAKKNGTKLNTDDVGDDIGLAVRRTNGVNSEFVLDDADHYVVGVQYPIFHEKWLKKKKYYELEDVIYVPWSEKLQTQEIIDWGRSTLDGFVAGVYQELRDKNIKSRAFPDRLMADVIDPALVKSIIVIEHVSLATVARSPKFAADSVQVILATNQNDAYAYSRSSAGAKGLVQFIPSTYKLLTGRKDIGLIKDFEKGMSDPHNAIKAEVAYLDAELATMPLAVKDLYYVNPMRVNEYLAASYNGGSGRIRRAVKAWGDDWSNTHAAEAADAMAKHDRLIDRGEAVKALIRKGGDAKSIKKLQAELADIRVKYRALAAQAKNYRDKSIRAETAQYVEKLRLTMPVFKQTAPILLAAAQ